VVSIQPCAQKSPFSFFWQFSFLSREEKKEAFIRFVSWKGGTVKKKKKKKVKKNFPQKKNKNVWTTKKRKF